MVHALEETYRVLAMGGILLDLRPITAEWPICLVTARASSPIGAVTALPDDKEDDEASNLSFRQAVERGLFENERQARFVFEYCWDSPSEMKEHVEGDWEGWVTIPEQLWHRIRSAWALADADARLHVGVEMHIARWRKLG